MTRERWKKGGGPEDGEHENPKTKDGGPKDTICNYDILKTILFLHHCETLKNSGKALDNVAVSRLTSVSLHFIHIITLATKYCKRIMVLGK